MVDLSNFMMQQNLDFYNKHAFKYAAEIEWNKKTCEEIIKLNICPVIKYCKPHEQILLAGCGSGRDYKIFSEKGFECLGIDNSQGMLKEAKRRNPHGNFILMDLRDIKKLNQRFDCIYCESALTHILKKDIKTVIRLFHEALVSDGIIYTAIKIGNSGIFKKKAFKDWRYFVVYRKQEFSDLLFSAGFKVIWQKVSQHTLKNYPDWLSLIANKIK